MAIGANFIYLLAAVVTTGDEDGKTRLPNVRGLASKTGKGVATAISAMMKEMEAALGVKEVTTRFHTDSGKEFYDEAARQMLSDLNIYQSGIGGYGPNSNGLAERFVGIIKQRAGSYMTHSNIGPTWWYWASQKAAYVYRSCVLDAPIPANAPTFGNRVLVRDIQGEQTSFAQRSKEGIFLCWSSEVVHGAKVAIPATVKGWNPKRDTNIEIKIVTVSGPKKWPNNTKVWKLID